MPLNIAILASGTGTNAARIMDLSASGRLDVRVKVLVSNRPDAPVLAFARAHGIPCVGLDHKKYQSRELFDREMLAVLAEHDCRLIALAGYMRLLTSHFLHVWKDRVINIHPALLPSFPGAHGAADALAWGVKISGVTVHFVKEEMDSGPPIIQAAVPVLPDDDVETLQARIHAMEYRIYPQALQWLAEGRVRRFGRKVWIENIRVEGQSACPDALIWPPLDGDF